MTCYLYIYTLLKSSSLNRIKEILEEKQLTQGQLGEIIGKSFETINAYCGNRRQPSLELLYEISTALKCSVKDLLVDNNELKKK
jgi:transcriptional regulator with XRE-family HTH domain